MSESIDTAFMKKVLALASKGKGFVSPNPMVGAVIVKEGKIIGKGYHRRFGEAHAEVIAIEDAGEKASSSTLYVNLEPCSHHGKTPPCVDAIAESGITKVVAGMKDPNPLVDGKGFEILAKRGIEVKTGVLEDLCKNLNEVYIKYITTGIPFITIKIAQSIDGRIATSTGHSKWISSDESRIMAHRLRAEHDAVMVGAGTIRADDPMLTLHETKGREPHRIVLDDSLSIPLDSKILNDDNVTRTIIVTTALASPEKVKRAEERGAKVLVVEADEKGMITGETLWRALGEQEISSILVEGGKQVFTSVLKSGYADRIVVFIAPRILGDGLAAVGDLGIANVNAAIELENINFQKISNDYMIDARFKREE